LPSCRHRYPCAAHSIPKLRDCSRCKLHKLPPAHAILSIEHVVVDVAAINCEPLPRHPFITLMPACAMGEKVCADLRNRQLARVRTMGAREQLPLEADAESVSRLLIREMLALSVTSVVGVVHHPGSLYFARRSFPTALAN